MSELIPVQYSWLIPLLPALGALVAGLLGAKWLKGQSHWPIWIGVGAAAALSLWMIGATAFSHHQPGHAPQSSASVTWYNWISAGSAKETIVDTDQPIQLNVNFGAYIDPLSLTMLGVVCGIGFLITVFAAGYMKGEKGYFRFFAYVGLFISAMTILVLGDNLILLYMGWEGVGLCSYLLIGYYYDTPAAREACKKAFLVNRIGDLGFALGIMLIFYVFGTVSFFGSPTDPMDGFLEKVAAIYANGGGTVWENIALAWAPFLLLAGAFGKSAQFPLYVWLPDAMAGPTPVSALIHAATMVTAGVYMIVRCGPLFYGNEAVIYTIAIIGCFTAVFAGSISLRQYDLKKDFAYSTVSQLGFMFVAAAALSPVAAVFHLMTHAFFKALLFLSSGVIMHATYGELDMRKMSGLKKYLPITRWLMLIGCAALAGAPFVTAGFWSKDEILATSFKHNPALFIMMAASALMTAYYTFRLYFRVFHGPEVIPAKFGDGHHPDPSKALGVHEEFGEIPAETHKSQHGKGHDKHDKHDAHDDHAHHSHEPWLMIAPLIVLAIGSVLVGFINTPWWHGLGHYLGQSRSYTMSYDVANKTFAAAGETAKPVPVAAAPAAEVVADPAHRVTDRAKPTTDAHLAVKPAQVLPPTPFGQDDRRSDEVKHAEHTTHYIMMGVSALLFAIGYFAARYFHLTNRQALGRLGKSLKGVTYVLEEKYFVDAIYDRIFVRPLRAFGEVFFAFDRWIIDGLVWVVGFVPQAGGLTLKLTVQRGYLQGYAVAMLLGVAAILLVLFF